MAHADKADKEGWLTKQSMWLKDWRRRYFRLVGNQLHFCKSESEAPHGTISLAECLTVKSADEKTGRPFSFEVATPDTTYFMCATSVHEKDEWIGAIGRAIVRFSSSAHREADAAAEAAHGHADDDDDDDDDGAAMY